MAKLKHKRTKLIVRNTKTISHTKARVHVEFPELSSNHHDYFVYFTVDGERIPYEVNVKEFEKAVQTSGFYGVFMHHCDVLNCATLKDTEVQHREGKIHFKIAINGDNVPERDIAMTKAEAHRIVKTINNHIKENKIYERLTQMKIHRLLEDKLKLLDEVRHKDHVIKEYKIGLLVLAVLSAVMMVRLFLKLSIR